MALARAAAWIDVGYDRLRLLSIDVALAALGGGIMAAHVVGIAMPRTFYLLLPLSVWVVYTLDHLLDAHRMGPQAHTPRHRYHYRYATPLWIACAIGAVASAMLAFHGLNWMGLEFGAAMCALVVVHLVLVKAAGSLASPLLAKELGVGVIFTVGVWGLPLMRHARGVGWEHWAAGWPVGIIVQYFLLVMVNLLTFSLADEKTDAADHQTSFVLGAGRHIARVAAWTMLLANVVVGGIVARRWPTAGGVDVVGLGELVYGGMTALLGAILVWPQWMSLRERYRVVGDGAFLLPLLMVFAN